MLFEAALYTVWPARHARLLSLQGVFPAVTFLDVASCHTDHLMGALDR